MKIDRARALMFVGLLAASGCVITTDDDDDDNNSGDAGAPAEGGETSTGGKASTGGTDSGTMGGAAGEGPSGVAGEAMDGGAPASGGSAGAADEGGSGGETAATGGTSSGGTPSGGKTSTGGAPATGGTDVGGAGGEGGDGGLICDDSVGNPVGCAEIDFPDSTCEGEAIIQRALCEAAATNFKPRIAEEIEQCIALQSAEDLCEPEITSFCAEETILGSCPDDDAAVTACAEIANACDAVDDTECLLYLSAMTEVAQVWMVSCMAEGLTCDLHECAGLP